MVLNRTQKLHIHVYERFNKHHPFYNKPNDSFNPVCKRRILTTKYTPSKPYSYFCVKFKSFLPCDRDEGRETETKYTSNERESYHPVVWILLWIHGNKYTKMNSVKDIDEMYACTMQSEIPMLWHRSAWTNPVEISWCCFNKNEYHTPTPSVNASLFRFHQVCHSIEHFYYSHFACYVYAIEEKKTRNPQQQQWHRSMCIRLNRILAMPSDIMASHQLQPAGWSE